MFVFAPHHRHARGKKTRRAGGGAFFQTHLYHRRVSVLLDVAYDFDSAIAARFPVPALQHSSECALSKGCENFICRSCAVCGVSRVEGCGVEASRGNKEKTRDKRKGRGENKTESKERIKL